MTEEHASHKLRFASSADGTCPKNCADKEGVPCSEVERICKDSSPSSSGSVPLKPRGSLANQ